MAVVRNIDESTAVLAGLSWDVADKGMGRAEARSRAKNAAANAFLLRAGERNLASAQLPGKIAAWQNTRIVPLGGALADAVSDENWCGVFEFEGQHVFFAADHHCILPDADEVYPSAADARARLDTERDLFKVIYAPAAWNYPDALPAADLLDAVDWIGAPSMQIIAGAASQNRKLIALACASVAVLSLIGFQYWRNVQLEREAAERARQTPPPPPIPWLDKAKAGAAFRACQSVRAQAVDMGHYGWRLEKLECDFAGQKFTATLVPFLTGPIMPPRDPGTTLAFKSDGTGITFSGPLSPGKAGSRANEKGSLNNALLARNIVVSYGRSASWRVENNRHHFSLQLSANLGEVAARLNALPTLFLTRIELSGEQWRVDGEIFN